MQHVVCQSLERRNKTGSANRISMSDDTQLITGIANEDRHAMRLFYERYQQRLFAFIRGRGADPQTADDVVQETMMDVWRPASLSDQTRKHGFSRSLATNWSITNVGIRG